MRINIYYGGRGLIDDPTLYVIGKMEAVLDELNVDVKLYHLREMKNNITTLPQTLKEADGVVLATTVEWYGIGGFMQQFLDACWLYGDKEKISKLYMCPIVMSTTYGEREGKLSLSQAWEVLGGLPCSGLCGYIADPSVLEDNDAYLRIIEKKTENLYRTISQKLPCFPASNQVVKQKVAIPRNIDLTPQESEQLSQYVSDDTYLQQQKEDIQELTSMFRDMMGVAPAENHNDGEEFVQTLRNRFRPKAGFYARYKFSIEEKPKPLVLRVDGPTLECFYGDIVSADTEMQLKRATMADIASGEMTFQRAFMSGDMTMKGDFKALRTLDEIFPAS